MSQGFLKRKSNIELADELKRLRAHGDRMRQKQQAREGHERLEQMVEEEKRANVNLAINEIKNHPFVRSLRPVGRAIKKGAVNYQRNVELEKKKKGSNSIFDTW